jgi:hypothetical protein
MCMVVKINNGKKKVRVNITVDKTLLDKAKKKLDMFGGKVSTLFNSYLRDFVTTMDKNYNENHKGLSDKVKDLEDKIKKLEKKK